MEGSGTTRFDGWTLVRASGELIGHGTRVRLQDQPLQVLEQLLAKPGEMVSREQLIASLWPKQVVEYDTALNAAVRRLRAALGDDPDKPRYIETIPRRGYRFIGQLESGTEPSVQSAAPVAEPESARRPVRHYLVAVALLALAATASLWLLFSRDTKPTPTRPAAAPATAVKSIVVLPFLNLTSGQEAQYFADGLTEELIARLARSESLRVIARTSSFAFKDRPVDIATVARELNVSHVLEGSVRRSGDRLRITAQLIDAATSTHLWTENYDRRFGEIFVIQDDIANAVAGALELRLSQAPAGKRPPDPRAYDAALQGRFLLNRRGPGDSSRSLELYEEAVRIDPDYARAWAGLANAVWIQVTEQALDRQLGLERMRAAAQRALSSIPILASRTCASRYMPRMPATMSRG